MYNYNFFIEGQNALGAACPSRVSYRFALNFPLVMNYHVKLMIA